MPRRSRAAEICEGVGEELTDACKNTRNEDIVFLLVVANRQDTRVLYTVTNGNNTEAAGLGTTAREFWLREDAKKG